MRLFAKGIVASIIIGASLLGLLSFLGKRSELELSLIPSRSPSPASPLPDSLSLEENQNYTNRAAEKLAQELVSQNQEGPLKEEGNLAVRLTPKKALEEMLATALEVREAERATRTEKDLTIIPDSPQTTRTYVNALQETVNTTLGDYRRENLILLLHRAMLAGDVQGLADFAMRAESALAALQKLPVPQSWVPLHKDTMNLIAEARALARDFGAWQNDPLRTLLALDSYTTFQEKLQKLLNNFASRMKTEGLL